MDGRLVVLGSSVSNAPAVTYRGITFKMGFGGMLEILTLISYPKCTKEYVSLINKASTLQPCFILLASASLCTFEFRGEASF